MKYYIIAGEASGDLHGSNLIKQLQVQDPTANIRCWGGDLMQSTGATLVKHYRDLAFMGFAEVIKNLPTILGNLKWCKQDIAEFKPDAIILIDYPGFNLRIAEWAKANGLKVIYYISPQVWAWKANRVKKMRTCIDLMLCILPFEKDYYKTNWNWDVEYVGHPLIEVIDAYTKENTQQLNPQKKQIIALLPGSRKQEIAKKLPIMLSVAAHFKDYSFVVAKAPGQDDSFYGPFLEGYENVNVVKNGTYDLLLNAKAALVTSGTATLETALFGVPEVVCYKASNISYQIAKRLIKIKYISLVNLIMDKLVVKELIQEELNTTNLVAALNDLFSNETKQLQLQKDYTQLKAVLTAGGHASSQAASKIIAFLQPA
ncbi:MAG: lipid-A-disaccharide synthase [Leadbetterella sp.]|nr:lipid-A-disaccharide synthase [Leadbetterella sp.]